MVKRLICVKNSQEEKHTKRGKALSIKMSSRCKK